MPVIPMLDIQFYTDIYDFLKREGKEDFAQVYGIEDLDTIKTGGKNDPIELDEFDFDAQVIEEVVDRCWDGYYTVYWDDLEHDIVVTKVELPEKNK